MISRKILSTGQNKCYSEDGDPITCDGTGQDGEYRKGIPWPEPRFYRNGDIVEDRMTGLSWTANASPAEFPVTWPECFDFIREINEQSLYGHNDWRLPDRNELRSLISYATKRPALPVDHPFDHVFLGWYWTSSTAAINQAYAWYIHMDGARMFYGGKMQYYMVWPVRGKSNILLPTEQAAVDNDAGESPVGLQDEARLDEHDHRFVIDGETVVDSLTGLRWLRKADLSAGRVSWQEALDCIGRLNREKVSGPGKWRLPNINELESLVDCSSHSPALTPGHPFRDLRDVYWSSTTSVFEPDWSWALYLNKGALGVGYKKKPEFYVWPVSDL